MLRFLFLSWLLYDSCGEVYLERIKVSACANQEIVCLDGRREKYLAGFGGVQKDAQQCPSHVHKICLVPGCLLPIVVLLLWNYPLLRCCRKVLC